jgi:hypothetical protein
LACSDFAGQYVGTIRANNENELLRRLRGVLDDPSNAARPLTAVRYIVVLPIRDDRHQIRDYVKELLRVSGSFTALDSEDEVPADQREYVVWAHISLSSSINNFYVSISSLSLRDGHGMGVRTFDGLDLGLSPGAIVRHAMREAVQKLIRARAEDEEIYRGPE